VSKRLQGRHIWNEQILQERFQFGREAGLHALLTRVYGGQHRSISRCASLTAAAKAGVELEHGLSTEGLTPVLGDAEYSVQREGILELLSDHALCSSINGPTALRKSRVCQQTPHRRSPPGIGDLRPRCIHLPGALWHQLRQWPIHPQGSWFDQRHLPERRAGSSSAHWLRPTKFRLATRRSSSEVDAKSGNAILRQVPRWWPLRQPSGVLRRRVPTSVRSRCQSRSRVIKPSPPTLRPK